MTTLSLVPSNDGAFPFGKLKGKPIELVMADRQYVEWLSAQPWFREGFAPIYNILVQGGPPADACTPEHNALQNLFLLARYPHADRLAAAVLKFDPPVSNEYIQVKSEPFLATEVLRRSGEEGNWDVLLQVAVRWNVKHRLTHSQSSWNDWQCPSGHVFPRAPGKWEDSMDIGTCDIVIELKPTLGDDYPAVLRKMKTRRASRRADKVVLLVDQFTSSVTSLADLKEIFNQSAIQVVTLAELGGW